MLRTLASARGLTLTPARRLGAAVARSQVSSDLRTAYGLSCRAPHQFRLQRQAYDECASEAFLAGNRNGPAVLLHDPARDGEAHSCPRDSTNHVAAALELFEDACLLP